MGPVDARPARKKASTTTGAVMDHTVAGEQGGGLRCIVGCHGANAKVMAVKRPDNLPPGGFRCRWADPARRRGRGGEDRGACLGPISGRSAFRRFP